MLFNEDGTRTEGTETRKVGSEFVAKFQMTVQEYEHICQQAKMLLPPKGITTLFNGSPIQYRKPCGSFTETLPIPLADKEGVVRNTERKATVYLYEKNKDEVATIFEMGIPIVELGDDPWHVNVMQKVPLSRDRDNVNPSYLRRVRTGVLNAKFEDLTESEEAGAAWVRDAVASPKSSDDAVRCPRKSGRGLSVSRTRMAINSSNRRLMLLPLMRLARYRETSLSRRTSGRLRCIGTPLLSRQFPRS